MQIGRQEALGRLEAMLGGVGGPLAPETLRAALEGAVVSDKQGRNPQDEGWQPSYDLEWAAAQACEAMAFTQAITGAGERVKRISSEGATIEVETVETDWAGLARAWYRRSALARQLGVGQQITVVDIPLESTAPTPTSDGVR